MNPALRRLQNSAGIGLGCPSAFSHAAAADRPCWDFTPPRRQAFTLIELLVVIGIIAILAAITIPIALSMHTKGKQTASMSNMRQIGVALISYAGENNGNLPETTHTTGVKFNRAWIFALKPFLNDVDRVRICPADPIGKQRLQANGTSYVLNSYVFVPQIGPFGQDLGRLNNVNRLPYPAHTLIAFNVSDKRGASVMSDHTHSEQWVGNWRALCADIEPNRFRNGSSNAGHTNGSANYLYLDGHAENIPAREVKRRIEAGERFGKPPIEPEDLIRK
jgi:prepilin-type N-terminal cleavage/methylation domain-containing protein/prepilin-type processing-associated H-X9-DG protein